MIFEIGKFYRHHGGREISIIGELNTTMYGLALIAEEAGSCDFYAVGRDETSTANWKEITKEEWMRRFS